MKSYFAYTRVSTVKQGERGSSLSEQRDAIEGYAKRNNLIVNAWFEERETAATTGRHEFSRMLSELKRANVSGIIFHKIDRSARNLKDWNAIQDLVERGVDVHFTQESINLGSNEGRLTGDFLAVISSHYIRNLREEVKKGIRGRLKQGLYPLRAPLGYLDQGGGKPKIPDPFTAPLILVAFERYASGISLSALCDEMYRLGLRSKNGTRVNIARLHEILHNPFYIGIIRMKGSGEHYPGIHEPIVPTNLFQNVQAQFSKKKHARVFRHQFLFRRLISCTHCKFKLVGELQKGHVYYRCHTPQCPTRTIREDTVNETVQSAFAPFTLTTEETEQLTALYVSFDQSLVDKKQGLLRALTLQIENINARISRLMDGYIDQAFDRASFEEKNRSLLIQRRSAEEQRDRLSNEKSNIAEDLQKFLELAKTLSLTYETANQSERRELLKIATSNFFADGKNVVVELFSPFREAKNALDVRLGGPVRNDPRTRIQQLFNLLVTYYTAPRSNNARDDQSHAA
jgi:DNA invertase Pin-like site-specific DNA recombinase